MKKSLTRACYREALNDTAAPERALILIAGDGFKLARKKAVRVGVALISSSGLNQSPHDWLDFLIYEGKEDYVEICAFLEPLSVEIRQIQKDGYVTDAATGERYYVDFVMGGDKPWQLDVTGHRNMNFRAPFASCRCTKAAANDFTKPLDSHQCISCDEAAS